MFRIFWIVFAIIALTLCAQTLNRYLHAQVEYSNIECIDRAYMIYKKFDNQSQDKKDKDWLSRINDCAEIKTETEK
jgi:hypothetical protein